MVEPLTGSDIAGGRRCLERDEDPTKAEQDSVAHVTCRPETPMPLDNEPTRISEAPLSSYSPAQCQRLFLEFKSLLATGLGQAPEGQEQQISLVNPPPLPANHPANPHKPQPPQAVPQK